MTDRRWTVGLVHHAHMDIGYTDTQQRLSRRHVEYARADWCRPRRRGISRLVRFRRGYSQTLYNAGIRNLFVCLHSHSGMAPIGMRQATFQTGNA